MTLLSHGLAGELEDYSVGCNTLWPRTTIATAAIKNLSNHLMNISRTVDIMADAAHIILTSDSKKTNDQFFIDDEVLASVGVTDLQKYKCNPEVQDTKLRPCFMS